MVVVKKLRKPRGDKSRDYVDNKALYTEMCKYKERLYKAQADGQEKPRPQDAIGIDIIKIATNFARSPKFSGYPFKDQMISDAIENIVKYLGTFDETKYTNVHAWMSMVCFNAFIRRIGLEKKELYVKQKMLHREYLFGFLEENQNVDGDDGHASQNILDNDYMNNVVVDFERKLEEKRVSDKETSLIKKKKLTTISDSAIITE